MAKLINYRDYSSKKFFIMQNKDELLNQIIDNLTLIKNSKSDFSQIEKDIVLQNLREAYLLILRNQG